MESISDRKEAHLALSLKAEMRDAGADLPEVKLPYEADFPVPNENLDTRVKIAGHELSFPLIIGSMTGGTIKARELNTALRACSLRFGIGMGLGSIRACLADPTLLDTYGTGEAYWLFGNLGVSEIMRETYSPKVVRDVLQRLGCHGLYVHFNVLQEWVQPGGDKDLWTNIDKLARFVDQLGMPVIIKEVGSGIGGKCAERLARLNIAGIETASRSGTSWVRIEAARRTPPLRKQSLEALDALGISLHDAVVSCRQAMGYRSVIASGGVENPLTLVKCLALGADAVSIAQPFYAAYHDASQEGILQYADEMIQVARLIWRSTGAKNVETLRNSIITM